MIIVGLTLTERLKFETSRILCRSSIYETACDFFIDIQTRTVNNLFQIATYTMKLDSSILFVDWHSGHSDDLDSRW